MNSVSFQGSGNNLDNINNDDNEELGVKDGGLPTGSNNSIFSMKVHQKKSVLADPSGHVVEFNVTFALAVPGVFPNTRWNESFSTHASLIDQSSRTIQQYFHLEFDLFSKETYKETFKTDIGFYGSFAKIYPDKSESKVIPTWTDGEDTWISWIQHYKFWVTNHHMKDLSCHKMNVLIWNSKDKCSPKVRFDRPKPPRSASKSKVTNENVSWIKQTVLMMSRDFMSTAAYKENSDRILPHQIMTSQQVKKVSSRLIHSSKSLKNSSAAKSNASSPDSKSKDNETLIIYTEPKREINSKLESYGQLEKLIEYPHSAVPKTPRFAKRQPVRNLSVSNVKESDSRLLQHADSNFIAEARKNTASLTDNERYNKHGHTSLTINMSDLFLKSQTLNRIPKCVSNIEDMFCMVSTESEIISVEQKQRLNPLIMKIKNIKNFPISSEDVSRINGKYKPVYCEYQFADFPPYQTLGHLHNKKIYFDDVSIIFLGELSTIKITEQLLNSFFTIKLFTRLKQDKVEGSVDDLELLGDHMYDVDIGDINLTSDLKTVTVNQNPKPQGEARIDLSELIKKNFKFLEVTSPIVPVSAILSKEDNENSLKQLEEDQMNFLETETTIKVSFQLFESLSKNMNGNEEKDCYTRLVIINKDIKCSFIRVTCTDIITRHNCQVLSFFGNDLSEMQAFLYNIKNSPSQVKESFSGFFLADSKNELLVVESLQSQTKMLYDKISSILDSYQNSNGNPLQIKLLYNDSLVCEKANDFPILNMIPLILSKDISFFAAQPLLYVRDILPKTCFEGICRLKDLVLSESLQVVIRNNLIPSNKMIEDLSQYLCSHLRTQTTDELLMNIENEQTIKPIQKIKREQIKTAPIVSERKFNDKGDKFRAKNRMEVNYIYPDKNCVFSYSSQNKNAVSSSLKELRNQMIPKRKYTYSKDYLFSGTVDITDLDEYYLAEERKIKSEPRWINKGSRTTVEDFSEVNNLPRSRIEELKEPWKENELHSSFMQPTLPERDNGDFKFDTYIRPLHLLERNSVSIMPSYIAQKKNAKEKFEKDYQIWKDKVCGTDTRFSVHRLLSQTELLQKGRKSSNQISKLQGLRKNNLKKVNTIVKKFGDPNSVPAIGVLSTEEPSTISYTVGDDSYRNLILNYIPLNRKDKNFKSVYNPKTEIPIFKNPTSKTMNSNAHSFFISC